MPGLERSLDDNELTKSTLKGGSLLFLAAIAQIIFQFASVAILARLLSPADFGIAAVALIVIEFSQGLALLGIRPAIVQRAKLSDADIRVAYTIALIMSSALTVLVFISAGLISRLLRTPTAEPMISALSIIFLIQAQSAVSEGLAARERQFKLLASRRFLSYLVGYGLVGVTSALYGLGAWSLILAKIADATMTAVLLSFGARHSRRPLLSAAELKRFSDFGAGYTIHQLFNTLANQADNAVVARILGPAALGLYSRSYQIMRLPSLLIGNIIEDAASPGFSAVQNDKQRLARGFLRGLSTVNILLYLAAAICAILAPEIVAIALGPNWTSAAPLLALFSIAIPFRSTQRLATVVSRAKGANWSIAFRQMIYFIFVVVGSWIGSKWGLAGVVGGVTIAILVQTVLQFQLASYLTGSRLTSLLRVHLTPLPATLLLGLPIWLVAEYLRGFRLQPIETVALSSFAGLLTLGFGVAFFPLRIAGTEGVALLSSIADRGPKSLDRIVKRWMLRNVTPPRVSRR